MSEDRFKIASSWQNVLSDELHKEYVSRLDDFIKSEEAQGKIIYPQRSLIFNALNLTPLNSVKVVVLGQDPYHGEGQAHGLSFSVEKGMRIPPSLRNIYKELQTDLGCEMPEHGNLTAWAEQGVLLLNSVLTVEQAQAASHKNKGWEQFTDHLIDVINEHCENVVFLLWGAYAQKKGQQIDQSKHLVLMSAHPSPLSARRGFIGCQHFSKANEYLAQHGAKTIDWQVR